MLHCQQAMQCLLGFGLVDFAADEFSAKNILRT